MAYGIEINQGNIAVNSRGDLLASNLQATGSGSFHQLSVKTPRIVTVNLNVPIPVRDSKVVRITSQGVWDMSGNLTINTGCVGNCSGGCGSGCSGGCSNGCTSCSGCSGCSDSCTHR